MNIKKFVLKRKELLEKITKKFYQREKLNKEIKDINSELKGLDRVLLNGDIKIEEVKIK